MNSADSTTSAIDLLEREGRLAEAAGAALDDGDAERALRLAATAGDDPLVSRAAASLSSGRAAGLAAWLESRGFSRAAAIVHERVGAHAEAARAWENVGDAVRAARLHEQGGNVLSAARVLTERHRRYPDDDEASLALGELLLRQGRGEAAARALQAVAPASPLHARADRALRSALRSVGIDAKPPSSSRDRPASDRPASEPPPAPTPSHPIDTVLLGRYRVDRVVATTATGRVSEGVDLLTGRSVAIKLFRGAMLGVAGRDAMAHFQREFEALARLRHPRVVPALAFDPDVPAIVTAWMPGGTLADRLRAGTLSPAHAIEIAVALLDALSEAHRIGILHRDVKPSNVLFDASGAALLADFGAAHVGDASTTVTAGIIGTLGYMSPEAHLGRAVDVTADLYSVGALTYEAIVGVPCAPRDVLALTPSRAHPDLTLAHDDAILGLLERDPSLRPPSAIEAARRLRALIWTEHRARAIRPVSEHPGPRLSCERLVPIEGSSALLDIRIDRPITLVPATPEALRMARAFSASASPFLARIYRLDPVRDALWVEQPAGPTLRDLARPPSRHERALVAEALAALHRAGGVHGGLSASVIHVDAVRGVSIEFPAIPGDSATPDDDWKALSRIGGDPGA